LKHKIRTHLDSVRIYTTTAPTVAMPLRRQFAPIEQSSGPFSSLYFLPPQSPYLFAPCRFVVFPPVLRQSISSSILRKFEREKEAPGASQTRGPLLGDPEFWAVALSVGNTSHVSELTQILNQTLASLNLAK
jgi:hypothetical protein